MPDGYAIGAATLVGGALLGFGAYVNRACVFGAIARLGSGEWAYVMTPLGFYVGCATVAHLFPVTPPAHAAHASPVLQGSAWLALLAAAFVIARVAYAFVDFSIGAPWRLRVRPVATLGPARLVAACGDDRDRCRVRRDPAAVRCVGLHRRARGTRAWHGIEPAGEDRPADRAAGRCNPRWLYRRSMAQHARHCSRAAALLRRRTADGLGQPADPGQQRRSGARRHAAAAAVMRGSRSWRCAS